MEVCRYKWQNQADIETDFDERMGYIACYGEELGQVFLNMILNASDAIRFLLPRKWEWELVRGLLSALT